MKKLCLGLLSLLCLTLFSQGAAAATIYFSDLSGHWAENNIYYLASMDLVHGYGDNTFCPDAKITRAEFLTILANDAGVDLGAYDKSSTFSDVTAACWARKYINWGAANNIVGGYVNCTFQPDQTISRQEMATILYRYLVDYRKVQLTTKAANAFSDEAGIAGWALTAVKTMQGAGIINGKEGNCFDPNAGATRAESATMLANYLKAACIDNASPALTTAFYSNGTLIEAKLILVRQNGVLMIPTRCLLEAAGFRVTYFGGPQLIVADDINSDIEFWIGKSSYYSNGAKMTFSTAPSLINGNAYIPLFEGANASGFRVSFQNTGSANQTLAITYCDTPLSRGLYNFYGSSSGGNNVSGNVFLADSGGGGYFGSLVNGAMYYGSYTSARGCLYFGNWSCGVINGAGRMVSADGQFFAGVFSNGAKSCGVTYYADGSSFSGTWTKSSSGALYPASGTYTDKDGNVFGGDNVNWSGGALTVK